MDPVSQVTDIRMSSQGFTLLEVIIGLALIASVLVATLMIRTRLLRQTQHAAQVAAANVLAGRLVSEWKNGTIPLEIDQRRDGKDELTGYQWVLSCCQQEIEPGIFLKRLEVKVYANTREQEPIVAFEAWRSLR